MSSFQWSPLSGGVTTVNGISGDVTLVAGSGISITPSGQNITIASTVSAGANTALSNLTSPTAVNQDLSPGADNARTLGAAGKTWSTVYANALLHSSPGAFISLSGATMFDASSQESLDYSNRILMAANGTTAVDWQNRQLRDNAGVLQASWSTSGLSVSTFLLNGSTSGTLTQRAAATTSSYSVTWPSAQASGTQVLQNNGSGTLSWATATTGTVTSVALAAPSIFTVSGSPVTSSGTLTLAYSGTALPIANGGTGVTSVTTAPTATAWAGWDANKNLSTSNLIEGYTTTVTSAGTTTLTVGSTYLQYFTGTNIQTVIMPVVSTLVLGQEYFLVNRSTASITVQSSDTSTIISMPSNSQALLTVISTSGTGPSSWDTTAANSLPFTSAERTADEIKNLSFVATASANNLIVSLRGATGGGSPSATNYGTVMFQNPAGIVNNNMTEVQVTAATSITAPSGASFGLSNGVEGYIYVYLVLGSNVVLGLSGTATFDEGKLYTTTAITSGSTSATTLYTTSVQTNSPIRLMGRIRLTEATAGVYASAVSETYNSYLSTYINKSWLPSTGSMIYAASSNVPATLAIGSSGQVLTVSGGLPTWAAVVAPAGTLTGTTLAANVVSSSLTSVGTLTTGVWSATTIATTKGGTGLTSYTTGDTLYASATNVLSALPIGTSGQVLTVAGGVPTWATPSASGANQTLSNLTSPTAINQDLIWGVGVSQVTRTLKTGNRDDGLDLSDNLTITTGAVPTANAATGNLLLTTGDAGVNASGSTTISTGTTVDTNSGNVILKPGIPSGAGSRGKIRFQDGTEGTAGQVWTSTDTVGSGAWAAPSSGWAKFTLNYTDINTLPGTDTGQINVAAVPAGYAVMFVVYNNSTPFTGGGTISFNLGSTDNISQYGSTGDLTANPSGGGAVSLSPLSFTITKYITVQLAVGTGNLSDLTAGSVDIYYIVQNMNG